jgi:hypothetical protein
MFVISANIDAQKENAKRIDFLRNHRIKLLENFAFADDKKKNVINRRIKEVTCELHRLTRNNIYK